MRAPLMSAPVGRGPLHGSRHPRHDLARLRHASLRQLITEQNDRFGRNVGGMLISKTIIHIGGYLRSLSHRLCKSASYTARLI
jgi:hypothetical protein